jgi:hypothetical protein
MGDHAKLSCGAGLLEWSGELSLCDGGKESQKRMGRDEENSAE